MTTVLLDRLLSLDSSVFAHLTSTDLAAATLSLAVLFSYLVRRHRTARHVKTTNLAGPQSSNFIVGLFPTLVRSENPGAIVEGWVREHGRVFAVPTGFGRRNVTIADVKAANHFLARDTGVYRQTGFARVFMLNLFGNGILVAEDEDHRRQRKALTPAFSIAAIRGYLGVFYDSAYKIKSAWEALLDSGEPTIEVQSWMNHASLDDIGIAGFGYDFGALDGKNSDVVKIFHAFERPETSSWVSRILFLLGPVLPVLQRLPAKSNRMMRGIKTSMAVVADRLLVQGGRGAGGNLGVEEDKSMDKSIMGLLIKAEGASEGLTMSNEEVLAQVRYLIVSLTPRASADVVLDEYTVVRWLRNDLDQLNGTHYRSFYRPFPLTTTVPLTQWALIELCKHQDKQQTLRKELEAGGGDPTWDQLNSQTHLPYLNAVVQETLRLHPPLAGISRVASTDDVIPLSNPITTLDGTPTSQITIAKGTVVNCPVAYLNQAEEVWGPDAKEFKPERWLPAVEGGEDGLPESARMIQGYHHLFTFSDGPRLCLGRNFAVANFKVRSSQW
ncbi:hypothetical protein MD484_g8164, partial [Candolleomyces efflorescens]